MVKIALGWTIDTSVFVPLVHDLHVSTPPKAGEVVTVGGETGLEGGYATSLTADALSREELYDLLLQFDIGDEKPSSRISIILNDVYGISRLWWGHVRLSIGNDNGAWFEDVRFELYRLVKK